MWQQLLIGLVVLAAAGYVTWSFLSMPTRQRVLDALAKRGLLIEVSRRHRARLSAPGCSNCAASPQQPRLARSEKQP
ncbi:MAG TPA: hypothetical protein VNZ06_10980 [Steroidobacteraceae bacterium]|jgi:hypothetical protein|nr:hypothetical protein [Steroidobacteraceae bacterium]